MITLLSPAKTLNFDDKLHHPDEATPHFHKEAFELMSILKSKSTQDLKKLMDISDNLAELNVLRNQQYSKRHTEHNSNAAIKAFKGDVYTGLNMELLSDEDLQYANDHLFMLSGLYGVLRPLDRMQPYRLEMGTRLKNESGNNLYIFWKEKVTRRLNRYIKNTENNLVCNLASNEYFEVVDTDKIKGNIINIAFKEDRGGTLKFISFNAKKARGTMARYIIQERIHTVDGLKGFDLDGYTYADELSTEQDLLFIR